jgi:hypothetical protein
VRAIERLIKKTLPLTKLAEYSETRSFSSDAPYRRRSRGFNNKPFTGARNSFSNSERKFNKPLHKSANNMADKGFKKFGTDKFRNERPAERSFSKFKPKREDSRSDFGRVGQAAVSRSADCRPQQLRHSSAAGQKTGFDPLEYFSDRPETRVLTDRERFRASLRDNDRPRNGYKKNFSGKGGRRDNRFHR